MSQEHSNNKIAITVAVVGAIATIVAALISTEPWKNPTTKDPTTIGHIEPKAPDKPATNNSPVIETDCFIITGLMTFFLVSPDPRSEKLRTLAVGDKYKVLDKKKDRWGHYLYKVKDKGNDGWVMGLQCDEISPKCFE